MTAAPDIPVRASETEAETRAWRIDPVLSAKGWLPVTAEVQARMEMVCPGRLVGGGGRRTNPKSCDYVLVYRGRKLATIEAKAATKPYTEGRAQALDYADRLGTHYAYATNGLQWREYDIRAQTERDIGADELPTPDELWARTYPQEEAESAEALWRRRFGDVPFASDGGKWEPRYYQHRAITAVLDAVARGKRRALLTLATGTGKTGVAYQVAWKLSEARWTLERGADPHAPARSPRILFLADRNILADQAYNSFGGFSESARLRVTPKLIKKRGGEMPTHASVYFSIFQTLLTGGGDAEETEEADVVTASPDSNYLQFDPDFFDLIVIDECHRAGARDETPWRDILDYFSPAVQLGLTATPRRDENADSYDYFGDPVYSYSLRAGIEDGFLTPFKVRKMRSTIEDFVYRPSAGHTLQSGVAEEGDSWSAGQLGRAVVLPELERATVAELLSEIRPMDKTLVFCHTQEHAARIRDLINEMSEVRDLDYCVRVTADDGEAGEEALRRFQDVEKTIPAILTTSRKLSTGVDARNVRNIVLMRPITSMIEFKQIVGRGTRVHDGKDYFTIYDFVRAHEHFNDPEWDGEPEPPESGPVSGGDEGGDGGDPTDTPDLADPDAPVPERTVITLGPGEAREIRFSAATDYWLNGKTVSADAFLKALFGELGELVADEAELRSKWGDPDLRAALMEQLEARGFTPETLEEMAHIVDARDSDLFDVLAFVKFSLEPQTHAERAARVRADTLSAMPREMRDFLRDVLDAYEKNGVKELSKTNLTNLLHVRYRDTGQAIAALGPPAVIARQFTDLQGELYAA